MADFHSATFEWPNGTANNVIVTGTFDHWSSSTRLSKQDSKFRATVNVPWNEKVAYKFVVDGQWVVNEREPTEWDNSGNLNNIYVAPEKPAEAKPEAPVEQEKVEEVSTTPESSAVAQDSVPRPLADLAETVVAAEGTSSALEYVASGVGAAIQGVIGFDPVNANRIPIETPKAETVNASIEPTSEVGAQEPVSPGKEAPDADAKQTPVVNGTTALDISEPAKPIEESPAAFLPVATNEDNTLSTPAKAASSEDGPSTHVPASESEAAAPVSNDAVAVTPPGLPVTSEAKPSTLVSEPVSTPPTSPSRDATIAASPSVKDTFTSTVTPTSSAPASRSGSPAPSTPSVPTTPTKEKHTRFPSSGSTGSPGSDKSPTKFRTRSIRKSLAGLRRVSLKGIFGGKDKEEKEK
ncbi:Cruciform DNA binding protein [Marasmius crinis-equi]|uniref:Cruciform DNA binding protein n=1 Tax=Marasmius crinis-equi TaxID=585013 RepID=A0ABR3FYZ7_9AGAR